MRPPAADHRGRGSGVVGRSQWSRAVQEFRIKAATGGVDAHHLECIALVERGQQAVQPFGQHRLAGAGRPDQQQMMSTGCRNLERALRGELTFDVGEFERPRWGMRYADGRSADGAVGRVQQCTGFVEVLHRAHVDALRQRGFLTVL
jgi:hypothetical protein